MNSQQFKRYETDAEQSCVLLQLNHAKKKKKFLSASPCLTLSKCNILRITEQILMAFINYPDSTAIVI
jgi:hypothetical protein